MLHKSDDILDTCEDLSDVLVSIVTSYSSEFAMLLLSAVLVVLVFLAVMLVAGTTSPPV